MKLDLKPIFISSAILQMNLYCDYELSDLSVQGSSDEPGVVHGHAKASDGLVVGVELGQELSGDQVPDPDVVDTCRGQKAAVGEEHHRFHRAAHIKAENQTLITPA